MSFEIFGDVDRGKTGKPKSEYPSWYYPQHKEELEESIRYKKFQLDNGLVAPTEVNVTREALAKEEQRLEDINKASPRFSDAEIDLIAKVRKSLGAKIAEAMFTDSDMRRGTADAHEEARRITEFLLRADDSEIPFLKACEITISDGKKITREGAAKAWKIASRILGENSNVEVLRRP